MPSVDSPFGRLLVANPGLDSRDRAGLLAAGVVTVLAPETTAAEMVAQLSTILALRGWFRGGSPGVVG